MSFNLELEIFKPLTCFDSEDTTFSEAIETVFYQNNSTLKMNWDDLQFEFSIYSCISELYSQLYYIIEDLKLQDSGNYTASLLSNEFSVYWHCFIEKEQLTISTEWYVVPDGIEITGLSYQPLVCNKTEFLNRWSNILEEINLILKRCGCEKLKFN